MGRIEELLELASTGDEDIALQVASEFALMPETPAQRMAEAERIASAMADEYAPPPVVLAEDEVDALEDEAGF